MIESRFPRNKLDNSYLNDLSYMESDTKEVLKAFIRSLQHFIGLLEYLLKREEKRENEIIEKALKGEKI